MSYAHLKNAVKSCLYVNTIIKKGKTDDFQLKLSQPKPQLTSTGTQKTPWRSLECLSLLKAHLVDLLAGSNEPQHQDLSQKFKTFDFDDILD